MVKAVLMTEIFNKSSETVKRRRLRNSMPDAEKLLWSKLKGKNLMGFKFRQQYSIDHFIVDFYCPRLRLAIEIDGPTHFENGAENYDIARQNIIESLGIRFLRFTNREVYQNLNLVLEKIMHEILKY